jgi:hypothetical protein
VKGICKQIEGQWVNRTFRLRGRRVVRGCGGGLYVQGVAVPKNMTDCTEAVKSENCRRRNSTADVGAGDRNGMPELNGSDVLFTACVGSRFKGARGWEKHISLLVSLRFCCVL